MRLAHSTLTAKYSGGGGGNGGTATNKVTVVAQLKVDQIVVDPASAAGPLVPGVTTTLPNGSSVQLDATAASGQAVKLTVVGPCTLTGNVLKVNGVGSPFALTASTAGGNAYAPATVKYSVQTGIGAQTARVLAPPSGRYAQGRRRFLSKLTTVTNVNQPVRWRVSTGQSHCRVVAGGNYYRVKLVSRGVCTVGDQPPRSPTNGRRTAHSASTPSGSTCR